MINLTRQFLGKSLLQDEVLRRVFMLSDDAIVAVDKDMNILLFNQEAEQLFAYTGDEVHGRPFSLLVPEHLRTGHQTMVDQIAQSPIAHWQLNEKGFVLTGLRKGGEEFQTRTTLLNLTEGRRQAFVFIIRDISQDKKREEELLKLATTDPLTGVYNRREFIALAEREALRSRRYARVLSLMVLDLDRFQEFNNAHGHESGDKMLQKTAAICCQALRNVDIFGRWSGGEFIGLLPETSGENAMIIAERLRRMIGEIEIDSASERVGCTVSIGIAQFKKTESGIDEPVSRATKAIARAKKEGRNKVILFSE